jgi:hypothetical protein
VIFARMLSRCSDICGDLSEQEKSRSHACVAEISGNERTSCKPLRQSAEKILFSSLSMA